MLQNGGVGVLRTDTLYGVVARAGDEAAVERVYRLKDRDTAKSPIVLISSDEQLLDVPDEPIRRLMRDVWPGKVSVIVPSLNAPQWIARGNDSVAYRLPDDAKLRHLLEQAGPLIAPSANPEGALPAATIEEAMSYFGESVDFYVDGGTITDGTPSQLLRVDTSGNIERLR